MTIQITGMGRVRMESALQGITREMITDKSFRNFDRLDLYSKMGLAALSMALKDAGQYDWDTKRGTGLAVSTTYGCLATDAAYYETLLADDGPSPNLFAYTLPNCFLGEASILFGLTGPAFVVSQPHPSGLECLHTAIDALDAGETAAMLCGCCDAPAPRVLSKVPLAITGASFVMMESGAPFKSYGAILRNDTGTILLNNRILHRWPDLFTGTAANPAETPSP